MPRPRIRLAGILCVLVVVLVAGCGGASGASARHAPSPSPSASAGAGAVTSRPTPTATPSPQVGPPAAAQNLVFTGDLNGTMTALVAQSSQTPSACSERPVEAAAWASTLYGAIGGTVYGFVVTVNPYNGPGTYTAAQAQVQLYNVGDQQKTWESLAGDTVAFTVHNDNLTGTVEATLTDLGSNEPTLKVNGAWSCAP